MEQSTEQEQQQAKSFFDAITQFLEQVQQFDNSIGSYQPELLQLKTDTFALLKNGANSVIMSTPANLQVRWHQLSKQLTEHIDILNKGNSESMLAQQLTDLKGFISLVHSKSPINPVAKREHNSAYNKVKKVINDLEESIKTQNFDDAQNILATFNSELTKTHDKFFQTASLEHDTKTEAIKNIRRVIERIQKLLVGDKIFSHIEIPPDFKLLFRFYNNLRLNTDLYSSPKKSMTKITPQNRSKTPPARSNYALTSGTHKSSIPVAKTRQAPPRPVTPTKQQVSAVKPSVTQTKTKENVRSKTPPPSRSIPVRLNKKTIAPPTPSRVLKPSDLYPDLKKPKKKTKEIINSPIQQIDDLDLSDQSNDSTYEQMEQAATKAKKETSSKSPILAQLRHELSNQNLDEDSQKNKNLQYINDQLTKMSGYSSGINNLQMIKQLLQNESENYRLINNMLSQIHCDMIVSQMKSAQADATRKILKLKQDLACGDYDSSFKEEFDIIVKHSNYSSQLEVLRPKLLLIANHSNDKGQTLETMNRKRDIITNIKQIQKQIYDMQNCYLKAQGEFVVYSNKRYSKTKFLSIIANYQQKEMTRLLEFSSIISSK